MSWLTSTVGGFKFRGGPGVRSAGRGRCTGRSRPAHALAQLAPVVVAVPARLKRSQKPASTLKASAQRMAVSADIARWPSTSSLTRRREMPSSRAAASG